MSGPVGRPDRATTWSNVSSLSVTLTLRPLMMMVASCGVCRWFSESCSVALLMSALFLWAWAVTAASAVGADGVSVTGVAPRALMTRRHGVGVADLPVTVVDD